MFTYPANHIDNPSKVYDFAFLLTRKIGIYRPTFVLLSVVRILLLVVSQRYIYTATPAWSYAL